MPLLHGTHSHSSTLHACMEALTWSMPQLLRLGGSAGRGYVPQLLTATVTGLDMSDKPRTRSTLRLYYAFLQAIAVDLEPLSMDARQTSEECDAAISEILEPWAAEFTERCLTLLDHRSAPDKHNKGDSELLLKVAGLFFRRINDSMYETALGKIGHFLKTNLFHKALSVVGRLVQEISLVHPEKALDLFIPIVTAKILPEAGGLSASSASEEEKLCMLRVLSKAAKMSGAAMLPHINLVYGIVRADVSDSRAMVKEVGKLVRCTMFSLSDMYLRHTPVPATTRGTNAAATGYDSWGRYDDATTVSIDWHQPQPDEVAAAVELLGLFAGKATTDLELLSSGADSSAAAVVASDATGENAEDKKGAGAPSGNSEKERRWAVLKNIQNSLRIWHLCWGEDGSLLLWWNSC